MRNFILTTMFTLGAASSSAFANPNNHKPVNPFDEDVTFKVDSAELLPAERAQVDATAGWLKKHPTLRIVLEGHADHTGIAPYNADLATRRLEAVRNHLYMQGIAMDRIILVVYGEQESDQRAINPLDRRVVMYATSESPSSIAHGSLDHRKAITVVWTSKGTLFTEHRGLSDTGKTVTAKR